MSVVEELKAARALIVDEKNWMQDRWTNAEGGEKPTCFCADGALGYVQGCLAGGRNQAYYALCAACPNDSVIEYNDTHSHAEVLAVFDKAIAAEEAKLSE